MLILVSDDTNENVDAPRARYANGVDGWWLKKYTRRSISHLQGVGDGASEGQYLERLGVSNDLDGLWTRISDPKI